MANDNVEVRLVQEAVSFYWVWTKTGRQPKHFHGSAEKAEAEAQRLARKFPDKKFIVLHGYTKFGNASLGRGNNARGPRVPVAEAVQ